MMPAVPTWQRVVNWVAVVLHCTVVAFVYVLSGLVMPGYAVVGLWLVWLALLALAVHWLRRRSRWVLAVPVTAAAVWHGVGILGDRLLGWTA